MKSLPDYTITRYDKISVPVYYENIAKRHDASGLCYDPLTDRRKILIENRLGKRRQLNVTIEEICHAFFWDEPEYKVRKFSAQLGKVIYNRYLKQH
jgi:hypothetical protein